MEAHQQEPESYSRFLQYSTIGLSGLVGALLAIVWAPAAGGTKGLGIVFLGVLLGLLIGYRRRESKFFFYFTLIAICALASVISFSMPA